MSQLDIAAASDPTGIAASVESPLPVPTPVLVTARRRRLAIPVIVALLVGAWAVPALTHLAGVDWVLPPLVLVATAALMRSPRGLLDRLIVALGLLIGLTCVAGLLFSVWPWHLHPVPVAGLAFTVLVVFATATDRRPRFDLGSGWRGQLGTLIAGLIPLAVVARPFLGANLARRLDLLMLGEDLARLYNQYDAIRGVGGYPFFHHAIGGVSLSAGMVGYPSGSTFVTALLDSFVRSSTAQGSPVSAFSHFVWWFVLSYGLFSVCVVWAADWVARPFLHGWRRVVVVSIASGFCALSTLISMFVAGFISELFGLALLAVLFAILIRPPRVTRGYVVIVAALTVGLAFTYYLFLPVALVAIVAAAISMFGRLRRIPLTIAVVALLAAPLAVLPAWLTFAGHLATASDVLVFRGTAIGVNYNATFGAALLVLAAVIARWRLPSARRAGAVVLAMIGFAVAVGGYSIYETGRLAHYFDKTTHALLVTALITFGVAASTLRQGEPGKARRRALSVAVVAAVAVGLGLVPIRPMATVGSVTSSPPAQVSWGAVVVRGKVRFGGTAAAGAIRALTALPPHYDRPTVVIESNGVRASYLATKFVSAMRRDGNSLDDWSLVPWLGRDAPYFIDEVRKHPDVHLRYVVIGMPDLAADLSAFANANPEYNLEVVTL